MDGKLAPLCLFVYNRLEETKKTVSSLLENTHADQTRLFVFSDGPKDSDEDRARVAGVRAFIRTVQGFRDVTVRESDQNEGLANSVISGVTEVLKQHRSIIVLEDDLLTSRNFLSFMNQALWQYAGRTNVFGVTGYSIPGVVPPGYPHDTYFSYRSHSWGWGTWDDRWEGVDWDVLDYDDFARNRRLRAMFNRGGIDLSRMLRHQMAGKLDSWAIRWCYNQFKADALFLYPVTAKVRNIGFGPEGTHCKGANIYDGVLDESGREIIRFQEDVLVEPYITKKIRSHFSYRHKLWRKGKALFQRMFE